MPGTSVRAQDNEGLAKAAQNPIADMISLPFQNNTTLNAGPKSQTQNVLNIQPVFPIGLNPDWNVITRTIVPIISQPDFGLPPHRSKEWPWRLPVLRFLFPESADAVRLDLGRGAGGAIADCDK
jgi:hypothetical protein